MTHQRIDYVEIMRAHGLRVTPQRLTILDAVCEGGGHTTLGEVYARVRARDRSIDRSTVYRALDVFVALGLVVSAELASGETVYEIAHAAPHHHLVCQACGREMEVEDTILRGAFRAIAREYGFAVRMDHLVLYGLCAACQVEGRPDTDTLHAADHREE